MNTRLAPRSTSAIPKPLAAPTPASVQSKPPLAARMIVGRATDGLLRENDRSSGLTTTVLVTVGSEKVVPRATARSSGEICC